MLSLSHSQLEDNLRQSQQTQDFAAQAETLLALAALANEEEEYSLAQGLYGQAAEAAQQAGDQQGITRAFREIGNLLSRAFQDQGVDSEIWDQMVLTMALAIRDRQSQAETYLSLNSRDVRWASRHLSPLVAYDPDQVDNYQRELKQIRAQGTR